MCIANDVNNPRRRHRPAYLAPSRSSLLLPQAHPSVAVDQDEEEAPHMIFPQQQTFEQIRQEDDLEQYYFNNNTRREGQQQGRIRERVDEDAKTTPMNLFHNCYRNIKDLLLLVAVMIMSFFLYDVEIKVVKKENTTHESTTRREPRSRRRRSSLVESEGRLLPHNTRRRGFLVDQDNIV